MSTHRAAAALLVALLLIGFAPDARGQDQQPTIVLALLRQTPWSSPSDPLLDVAVRAENQGPAALHDLSLAVSLGAPVRTRGAYDSSLTSGPTVSIATKIVPQSGDLGPGQARKLSAQLDLSGYLGVSRSESLIYPMLVSLLSSGAPTGGQLRSAALFFVRKPLLPLSFAWTIQLAPPPALGSGGSLTDPAFATSLAHGGSLHAEIDALGTLADRGVPVDLVVSPLFLDELARMADGYTVAGGGSVPAGQGGAADARAALDALRRVTAVPSTQLLALPYAVPNVPAMLASGLTRDLEAQISEAAGPDGVIARILGVQPTSAVVRPPYGALDQPTIDLLARNEPVLLGDADTVTRAPDPLGFLLPPLATLAASGGTTMPIVLPDPPTQALLEGGTDPVLRAQVAFGELAAAWQEHPGDARGIAVSLADTVQPARFWDAFARRIADAPFLRPMHADVLVSALTEGTGPPLPAPLASPSPAAFSHSYAESIRQEHRRVDAFAAMLVDQSDVPSEMQRSLLVAENGTFVGNETAGRPWIDSVNVVTQRTFDAVQPPTPQLFTLISSSGSIPIQLGDPGLQPLDVIVQIESNRLRFPEGDRQAVRLEAPDQVVPFKVEIPTTGRIPVKVLVLAPPPSGRLVSTADVLVRSTAYNRIALAITLAAALVLLAMWTRRLFRRLIS